MKTRFEVRAHIPRGSGDAEYRIMSGDAIIATVDPMMELTDPAEVAQRIVDAMNVNPEAIL